MPRPQVESTAKAWGLLVIGKHISQYRVIEMIEAGKMGVVYKAEQTRLDRFAALKFLPDEVVRDAQSRVRFRREAQAGSALKSRGSSFFSNDPDRASIIGADYLLLLVPARKAGAHLVCSGLTTERAAE